MVYCMLPWLNVGVTRYKAGGVASAVSLHLQVRTQESVARHVAFLLAKPGPSSPHPRWMTKQALFVDVGNARDGLQPHGCSGSASPR